MCLGEAVRLPPGTVQQQRTKISAYIRVTAEEYALNSTSDRIIIAHITEHGKYVAKDNAVETAGAALCK